MGGGPSGIAILISRTIHSEEGEAGILVGIMAISISTFIVKRGVYEVGGGVIDLVLQLLLPTLSLKIPVQFSA